MTIRIDYYNGEEKYETNRMPNLNNKLSLNFKSKRELSNEFKFDFNELYFCNLSPCYFRFKKYKNSSKKFDKSD